MIDFLSGKPRVLALTLEVFLGYTKSELAKKWKDPIKAIKNEINKNGTEDDKLCLDYVLNKWSGTVDKEWENGVMDAKRDQNVNLDTLLRHKDAEEAKLERYEVLAGRLYTTAAYKSINGKLRARWGYTDEQLCAHK